MSVKQLSQLNPGHNRLTTAPNGKHTLLLPIPQVARFNKNLLTLSKQEKLGWKRYQVEPGDSLSQVALRFHSSVSVIKKLNHLDSNVIHPKQVLLIAETKSLPDSVSKNDVRSLKSQDKLPGPKKVIHIVKKGESYPALERQYHIKAAAIRFWNQLSRKKPLQAGQKLSLWVKRKPTTPSSKTYTVKKGDTLSQIAHNNHLTIKQLFAFNPSLKHSSPIHPKQLIRLG